MTWPVHTGVLELGDLPVERGGVIRDCRLVYQTHGVLNAAGDNAIVYPCSYTAAHDDEAWLIGPDKILDPERWYIVIPDLFGNGVSSSPADTTEYPAVVTMADNVRAQHRLLFEHLGVTHLAAAYGFSMGACQSYHWAALYPDEVDRAFVVCGSARTSLHNKVFLSGLLRTLEAAPEHLGGGRFSAPPMLSLKALGHIYAGWGLSQDFYRQQLFRSVLGSPDLDTFLRTDWEAGFQSCDAANLYAAAMTWYEADISANDRYHGDLAAALAGIRAQVLLLPSETDLYFRVADNESELAYLRNGELQVIPGPFGHRAGAPQGLDAEYAVLRASVRAGLDRLGPDPSGTAR
jgi:homoserine O-acetyltransferase